MATIDNILTTPLSGYNHIDALLASGPDWNFLTSDGYNFRTTLYYSFNTGGPQYESNGLTAFNAAQQDATRQLINYVGQVTGIGFTETSNPTDADLHFAMADIANPELGGVCYADFSYRATDSGYLTSYNANAYIYLDKQSTASSGTNAGSWWYHALLHEVGHALGLKHPFESSAGAETVLRYPFTDSTDQTVMSYNQAGGYSSTFGDYDLAALNFLYGGDGLRGAWGIGTDAMYLTSSPLGDSFYLPWGKVKLAESGGYDRVYYSYSQASYNLAVTEDGLWLHVNGPGIEHQISTSVEELVFSDGRLLVAELLNPAPVPDEKPDEQPDDVEEPVQEKGKFIFGTDASDYLEGTRGNDFILGGSGNDIIVSLAGNDMISGGSGLDTVVLAEQLGDIRLSSMNGEGWSLFTDSRVVTMLSVERLHFADKKLALDLATNQNAGKAALLTTAVLGSQAIHDAASVGVVIDALDSGLDLIQASEIIVKTDWFQDSFDGSDQGFVELLLNNTLGAADSTTVDKHLAMLQTDDNPDGLNQAELMAQIAMSVDNQQSIDLIGLQQSGLAFI